MRIPSQVYKYPSLSTTAIVADANGIYNTTLHFSTPTQYDDQQRLFSYHNFAHYPPNVPYDLTIANYKQRAPYYWSNANADQSDNRKLNHKFSEFIFPGFNFYLTTMCFYDIVTQRQTQACDLSHWFCSEVVKFGCDRPD